ncbi:MAG TPA: hypothetical protein VMT69_07215 [Kineosporiaceae bacterium]|nr:hypothetical protein [Kineosporiaceae bacterium]
MFTYSSPELIDAEVRHRRERLVGDWQAAAGRDVATRWSAHRAWAVVAALGRFRATPRHHRHA